jgi:UDP-glucose 4-epimerase
MKYLITGGAGFIGSHLAEQLSTNHEVVILDDFSSGSEQNLRWAEGKSNVSLVTGSVTDASLVRSCAEGCEGIFHQAAIASVPASVRDPVGTHEVNCTGTLQVLEAARKTGTKNVVMASSAAVYGDAPALPKTESMVPEPKSPYAIHKCTGEQYGQVYASLYGVKTVCLRYFNVYGPRQNPSSPYSGVISRFAADALQKRPLTIFGDGIQTRDFVFVADVVNANICAMESDAQGVFNVGTGLQTDLLTLGEVILSCTGNDSAVIFGPAREGDILHSCADISKAESEFGFVPEYSLQKGLEKTLMWVKEDSV